VWRPRHFCAPTNQPISCIFTPTQLVNNFPAFYGTRMFSTAFTRVRHLSVSWARSIQSMPPFNFSNIRFKIIHPSTPWSFRWCLSVRFPQKSRCTFFLSLIRTTCPAHLIHTKRENGGFQGIWNFECSTATREHYVKNSNIMRNKSCVLNWVKSH
jgi:hypothetical protein